MLIRINFIQTFADFCKSCDLWFLIDILFSVLVAKVRLPEESNSEILPEHTFSRLHHINHVVVRTTQNLV